MAKPTVCLDPGHGGSDVGAVGPTGAREKDYNLAVALFARSILVEMGYPVVMTREDDRFVELSRRAEMAKQAGAAVLVSVHHNSAPSPQAKGTEVFYCPGDWRGKRLASAVYGRLIELLGTQPRGVKEARLVVPCRASQLGVAACLAELAFLSNPEEEALIRSAAFREGAARAIAEGVDRFFAGLSPSTLGDRPSG